MKKIKSGLIILGLVIVVGLVLGMSALAKSSLDMNGSDNRKIEFVKDEIIVKFKGDIKPFRVIKVPEGKVFEEIEKHKKRADVVYAEPNYIVHIDLIPNDTNFSLLYGLHNTGQTGGTIDADIDAPEAWDIQTGSGAVLIAVIDTGVDYTHEDLSANIWTNPGEIPANGTDDDGNGFIDDVKGWDFYNEDNDPFDDHGHGTHCAGTIGAVGNNGAGVVGVNWNVKIMPLKFLSSGGSGTTDDAVEAINYATLMGANVMSNSWGGGDYSQTLKDAIAAANQAGVLFVAAAGNSGSDNDVTPAYPASYDVPNVVAVAATDHNDQKASWSNYGTQSVDLGAPGVNIYSTVPTGTCSLCNPSGYRLLSGTSMATPHVSGVAGLIKAQFPTLTSDSIKSRLLSGVDQIPSLSGITVTGGRLNAYNVLEVDNIPPATVTDLAASNPTIGSVTLTWTATGDDENIGTANSYDVRYSTLPISDASWDTEVKATGEPKPQAPGSIETFTVTALLDSTNYYFALKIFDNAGNSSGLSNIVSETTRTPAIIFQDNMENGVNGWTYNDLWHQETKRFNSSTTSWTYNTGFPNYNYDTGARNSGSLTSPIINLTDYKSAFVDFWYWYETETSGIAYDQRWIQIGVNGDFTNKVQLSGDLMKQWNKYSLGLSSYVGKPNVQIRFFFDTVDNLYNNYEGWLIDDVMVYGELAEPNNPPIANDQSVATDEDASTTLVLTGSDPDGDPITFKIATQPNNGILSTDANFSTNGKLTYIPNLNFNGSDSFTFVVNDGKIDSQAGTVSFVINPVNDRPLANSQLNTTLQNTSVNTTLKANDVDGDPLTYYILTLPLHGTLTGEAPNITYTPALNYTGGDSFTFKVNDGELDSNTAIVSITVKTSQVKCWSASYQYLYRSADQAKKFCKCAQGTYGYKSYSARSPKQTFYQYVDTGDNEYWNVASRRANFPVYAVTCTDSQVYLTNQNYFYPK